MSNSEGPTSRPRSPRSGLGRGRGKASEGRPGVRPAPPRLGRSDSPNDLPRGIAPGTPTPPPPAAPAAPPPPPAPSPTPPPAAPPPAENASPSQLSLLEVQISLLSTKVAALEESKDKVENLQSALKEVEKRANFLQKANETLTAKLTKLEEEQSKSSDDQGGNNNAEVLDGFSARMNRLEASVSSLASKPPPPSGKGESQEAGGNGSQEEDDDDAPPKRVMQRAKSLAEASCETVEEVKAKLALDNGDIMLALERVMSLETKMRGLASTVEAQGQTLEAVKTLSQPPPPPGAPPPPPSGPPPLTVDVVIEREVKRLWTSVQRGDMDVQKLARLVTSEISAGKYSQSQATEIVRRVRLLDAKETSAKPPSKPSSPRAAKNGDDDSDLELAGDDDDEEGRGGKGTKAKPLPVEPKRRSSLSSGGPGALAEPDVPFKVRFFTAIPPHVLSKIGVDAAGYVVLLPLEMSSSTGQPANWAQGLQPGDRIVSVEHRKVDPLPPAPSRSSTASMFMGGSAASKQQKREKAKVESVCDQIRKAEGAVAGGGYAITFVRPSDSTKTTTAAAASTARAADNGKAATAPTAKRKPRNSIFAGFISSSSGKSDSPSEVLEADTAAAAPAEEEDPLEEIPLVVLRRRRV